MKIAVIGLGLIGASMAKALTAAKMHVVGGYDISDDTCRMAADNGDISQILTPAALAEYDVVLIALYPQDTVAYVLNNIDKFKCGAIVCDLCGVKRIVHHALENTCRERGIRFVGGHPMAGRETSGYSASSAELFRNASMILTPPEWVGNDSVELLRELFVSIGFGKCIVSTPERHDRIIAYTSQLAHIVSNAYVKSPAAESFDGYSAGSFKDLTRVAQLNEIMWSELFLQNGDYLVQEIDEIVLHLSDLRDAIAKRDEITLKSLLKEGSDIKKRIDSQ